MPEKMTPRILLLLLFSILLSVYLGTPGTFADNPNNQAAYCTLVLNCYSCPSKDANGQQICTECNHQQFFLDTDVYPPVCRNCSELPGCLACFSKQRCSICRDPGYNGPNLQDSIGSCGPCAPNCKSCNVSGSGNCDGCKPGYFLDSNQQCSECADNCIICPNANSCYQCQSGFYRQANGICAVCPVQGCAKCQSDGTCLTCIGGTTPTNAGTSCSASVAN